MRFSAISRLIIVVIMAGIIIAASIGIYFALSPFPSRSPTSSSPLSSSSYSGFESSLSSTSSVSSSSSITTITSRTTSWYSSSFSSSSSSIASSQGLVANFSLYGAGIVYDSADGNIYDACPCAPSQSYILKLNSSTNEIVANFSIPIPGIKFQYLAYNPANEELWAFTTNGAIVAINTTSQTSNIIMNLSLPFLPFCPLSCPPPPFYSAPVYDPANNETYVGVIPNQNNNSLILTDLLVFNKGDSLIDNVTVHGNCEALSYDPNNQNIYCLNAYLIPPKFAYISSRLLSFNSENTLILNVTEGYIPSVNGGGTLSFIASEPQKMFLFNDTEAGNYFSQLLTINTTSGKMIERSAKIPMPVEQVASSFNGSIAYLLYYPDYNGQNYVGIFSFSNDRLIANVNISYYAATITYDAAANLVFAAGSNRTENLVYSFINATTNKIMNTLTSNGYWPVFSLYDNSNREIYATENDQGAYCGPGYSYYWGPCYFSWVIAVWSSQSVN